MQYDILMEVDRREDAHERAYLSEWIGDAPPPDAPLLARDDKAFWLLIAPEANFGPLPAVGSEHDIDYLTQWL